MKTFTPGDTVRLKSGPFVNCQGKVKAVNQDRSLLKITVKVFGRQTPIILQFSEVEKV
jgi:transcription termination/antitermination protein NusG